MVRKNDEKSDEELTYCFKMDKMNLKNFDWSTGKSQRFKF